jgi:hypothetical protein
MKRILIMALLALTLTSGISAQEIMISQKVETDNKFEIQGTVASVNESSFTVRGELVAVSSEDMSRLKNNHVLNIGNFVNVEGEIKNNIMVADNVEVLGHNPEAVTSEVGTTADVSANVKTGSILKNIVDAIKGFLSSL